MASVAHRRLMKELSATQRWRNPYIVVRPPDDGNLLELHFLLHSLPADTPYANGCYHGKLIFTEDYPMVPPRLQMITQTGRFRTNMDICTSGSSWHPEQWNPDWSVMTLLTAFLSLLFDDRETGVGFITAGTSARTELASRSWRTNARNPVFVRLFPDFVMEANDQRRSDDGHFTTGSASDELEGARVGGSADVTDGSVVCRFCKEGFADEPCMDPLPCACRGSIGGVHDRCLQEWVQHSGRLRCGTCKKLYTSTNPSINQLLNQFRFAAKLCSVSSGLGASLFLGIAGPLLFNRTVAFDLGTEVAVLSCLASWGGRYFGRCLLPSSGLADVKSLADLDHPEFPVALAMICWSRLTGQESSTEGTNRQVLLSAKPFASLVGMIGLLGMYSLCVWCTGSPNRSFFVLLAVNIALRGFMFANELYVRRLLPTLETHHTAIADFNALCAAGQRGIPAAFLLIVGCIPFVCKRPIHVEIDQTSALWLVSAWALGSFTGRMVSRRLAALTRAREGLASALLGESATPAKRSRAYALLRLRVSIFILIQSRLNGSPRLILYSLLLFTALLCASGMAFGSSGPGIVALRIVAVGLRYAMLAAMPACRNLASS